MPERNHPDIFHDLRALDLVLTCFLAYIADLQPLALLDRNPFILFRTAFVRSGHVPADVEPDHRNLSRIAGEVWRRMTPAEKKKWNDLADEVKEEHKREHPNYRYWIPPFCGATKLEAWLTRICHRYQPDFHRPEPVRRRKTRRRVIVEEVETESNSELGEDPAAIQNAEEGAPPSVQDAPPSSSSAVARHSNGISAGPSNSSSSKTRAGPRKRAAGVNMQPQPSKVKVRTVAVPERPREYLSKVAALVHAGHNGNALLQAVQSAPVSAPMSESERSVEPREQRPPRQQHLQLVSLAETPTPDELIVVSRRDPEGLRQVSLTARLLALHARFPFRCYPIAPTYRLDVLCTGGCQQLNGD